MGYRIGWVKCAAILGGGAALVGLGLGIPSALGQKAGGIQTAPESRKSTPISFSDRINRVMGLRSSTIVDLAIDPTPGQPLNVPLAIGGQTVTLALMPHSVRAPGYQLLAQVADGSIVPMIPGPERMLRGSVVEWPGSVAAGGLLEDGLHCSVMSQDGTRWWFEPIAHVGGMPGQYVVYRGEDVIPSNGVCGTDAAWLAQHPSPMVEGGGGGGGTDGAAVSCTEIGIDADVEYYIRYGSNVTNVQNRINLVINQMDLQYINQVDIDHVITAIIVRTAEPDPYTSTDAGTLLGQFRTEWLNNQNAIPRDVAQLFTNKSIDGSTIGIAWTIGGICTTSAYCLVQSDCCGSDACATDLSAHELGHLWGGFHCTSACSSTMNPSITCVNTFLNSNPDTVAAIVAHRNSRTCLSACADATLPFFDDFPTTTFDTTKWTTVSGAIIDTIGINEPSAPNSMRLRGNATTGGNQVRTSRINTAGLAVLQLDYFYQLRGGGDSPEAGDDLIVEYFNNAGAWVEISRHLGSGADMTTYAPISVSFPADAMHSEFRLRFRVASAQTNADDWFVDNVGITGVVAPVNNNCVNASTKGVGSHAFTTLGASTDGPAECAFNGFTQIDKDIWYKTIASCTGTMTVSLCGANYNAKMASYTVCPSGSGSTLACNDDFCGTSPQISFPVNSGTVYRIRIGGQNNASGSGTMVISCTPSAPPCPADINHDNQVNVTDLLAILSSWGPCAGCPADINSDGQVNVTDLLAVISQYGPCP